MTNLDSLVDIMKNIECIICDHARNHCINFPSGYTVRIIEMSFKNASGHTFGDQTEPDYKLKFDNYLYEISTFENDLHIYIKAEIRLNPESEYTLMIIKPDMFSKSEDIIELITLNNLNIALNKVGDTLVPLKKRVRLNEKDVEAFYADHIERPFFPELRDFMTSGECVVAVLAGVDAVSTYRKLMGDTDPAGAEFGTIRKLYGTNKGINAVHGSDSIHSAKKEIGFFFPEFTYPCCLV